MAEEPPVLIAVRGPSLRAFPHWSPGNLGGRAQRGLAGSPAPGGKGAGSQEEPHLSFYRVRSKRLPTKFGISSLFG